MTRDEIKKLFPEATDEQVSALLSSHHSEMNKLKDDNKSLKEKADKHREYDTLACVATTIISHFLPKCNSCLLKK